MPIQASIRPAQAVSLANLCSLMWGDRVMFMRRIMRPAQTGRIDFRRPVERPGYLLALRGMAALSVPLYAAAGEPAVRTEAAALARAANVARGFLDPRTAPASFRAREQGGSR
ncbi:MAG: hypothetical protein BroJett013_29670 [Alphaproteobacteria bacterium]|nr:MAG: hypothetical protein BroJett013_29670 [Alphaproteobacteria bacterium]